MKCSPLGRLKSETRSVHASADAQGFQNCSSVHSCEKCHNAAALLGFCIINAPRWLRQNARAPCMTPITPMPILFRSHGGQCPATNQEVHLICWGLHGQPATPLQAPLRSHRRWRHQLGGHASCCHQRTAGPPGTQGIVGCHWMVALHGLAPRPDPRGQEPGPAVHAAAKRSCVGVQPQSRGMEEALNCTQHSARAAARCTARSQP